jgi:hypothetical protein
MSSVMNFILYYLYLNFIKKNQCDLVHCYPSDITLLNVLQINTKIKYLGPAHKFNNITINLTGDV